MKSFDAALETAKSEALRSLDVSMFSGRDIANTALQRPEVLSDCPERMQALRAWARGNETPLMRLVDRLGAEILWRALGSVMLEYHALRPLLRQLRPRRIADIGCGYGFFDYFAHAEFGSDIVLIDAESSPKRTLAFRQGALCCADLDVARRFFLANGGHPAKIACVNPRTHELRGIDTVDLAVSFLACGYRFPTDGYRDFFEQTLRPGGTLLIDVATQQAHEALPGLSGLGALSALGCSAEGKALRMRLTTYGKSRRAA